MHLPPGGVIGRGLAEYGTRLYSSAIASLFVDDDDDSSG